MAAEDQPRKSEEHHNTTDTECGRPRPQRRPHARNRWELSHGPLRSTLLRPRTGALRRNAPGVRPSPAAATSARAETVGTFPRPTALHPAAPEDGRTPPQRPRSAAVPGRSDLRTRGNGGNFPAPHCAPPRCARGRAHSPQRPRSAAVPGRSDVRTRGNGGNFPTPHCAPPCCARGRAHSAGGAAAPCFPFGSTQADAYGAAIALFPATVLFL